MDLQEKRQFYDRGYFRRRFVSFPFRTKKRLHKNISRLLYIASAMTIKV